MKKILILCGLALCLAANAQAGVIDYLPAANHIYYGQDGFLTMYQMGIDNNDQILINQSHLGAICRVAPGGGVFDFQFAIGGSGTCGSAPIQDAAGNYVVTTNDNMVRRFQSDGTPINSWATSGYPGALAEDDEGNLWVAEHVAYPNMKLVQYDTAGNVLQTVTSAAGMPHRATLDFIGGIHMYDGLLYVQDAGRMLKFDPCDPAGTMAEAVAGLDYWGGNWAVSCHGLEIDASGRMYIAEYTPPRLWVYDAALPANANFIQEISDPCVPYALNENIMGIGVDAAGTVYVGDSGAWPEVLKFEVPEPTTVIMLGLGSLALLRRKRS